MRRRMLVRVDHIGRGPGSEIRRDPGNLGIMNPPIIIAGAGPVGLTLGLLLGQRDIPFVIYEAVDGLRPLGVGINLLPHSVRVLYQLGLEKSLDRLGVRTGALHYYNKFGQKIWAEPRGLDAGYPVPQYSVHRGEFQFVLLDELVRRCGAAVIVHGHRLTDWEETGDGVLARFETAGGEAVAVAGRALVAADGINSSARARLYPQEGHPIYGGRILWRGTTVAEPFLDGRTMFMAGHQDCKFVAYPISTPHAGTCVINWIAELAAPDWRPERQDWSKEVSRDKFAPHFAGWQFGWVDVPGLIAAADQVFEYPLTDRDPLPRWRSGHTTLIGDAAHPMYPIGSNGASQGILDAEALLQALISHPRITDALDGYEAVRRPATAGIVLSNRRNGPEQVMQMAEERAPDGFADIEAVIPRRELQAIADRYKQTAGFSVNAVIDKPTHRATPGSDSPQ